MYIAHQLKQTNIAEYLLYMWQVEEVIRAFRLNIEELDTHFLSTLQLTAQQHKQMRDWYESLIDMMHREGVAEKGHIQLNKNTILDLQNMHAELIQNSRDGAAYQAKFYYILPSIVQLKSKMPDPTIGDIEACFVFMFGIMQLKRAQKAISDDTLQTANQVSKFLALLANCYKSWNHPKE